MAQVSVIGVQIPENTSLSGGIDLGTNNLVAIEMPETWTGTSLTFQAKAEKFDDETTTPEDWDNVYDSAGSELTLTVAAGRIVVPTAAHAAALAPLRFIRLRAGTASAPNDQNPSKEIRLILKQA